MNSPNERELRILLVEDDPVDRMAIERLFEREDLPFVLQFARSVAEAIEALEKDPPDLALLDHHLPDGTGLEMQARLGDIPCIFITCEGKTAIAVEAMKAGATDFLVKDSSLAHLDLLPAVIDRVLKVQRLKEEVRRHHEELQELVEERTRELRESETRWRAVTESALEYVMFVDRDMVVRFMNRSTPWVAKENLVGRRLGVVIPSKERSTKMEVLREVLRTGEQITFETPWPISGGDIIHYEVRVYPRVVDGAVLDLVVNLLDITERKKAEIAVLESRTQLRALAQRLEEIREEEKANLARELHDELGQALTGLRMDLGDLRTQLPEEAIPLRSRLGEMADTAEDLLDELRNICGRLRPPILDVLGLPEAIEWQVEEFRKRSEVGFEVVRKDGETRLVSLDARARWTPEGEFQQSHCILTDITDQRRDQEALQEALEWQRATIEGSRDAIFVSDENSRFVLVNEAATELTGFTRDQLLEMTIPDLHEDVDRSAYEEHHDRIMAGEPALTEAMVLRADGTKVDVEFNNRRLEVGGVAFMHTVARDLTERREMERALRESEERNRVMVETTPDHILLLDPEFRIEFANFTSPGLTEEDLLGQPLPLFAEGPDRERVEATLRAVLETGQPAVYPTTYHTPDGKTIHYESRVGRRMAGSEPRGLVVAARDVTVRVLAEKARRETQERLELAQRVARIGLMDRNMGAEVEVWSDITYEILGLDPEETVAGPAAWLDAIHPDDRAEAVRRLGRLLHGEDNPGSEYRVVHPDGDVRWIRGVARTFPYPDGRPVGRILATVHDITEARAAEEQLQKSEERLRALASRLARIREEERTAISRELHDELGQALTGLRMDLAMERKELPEDQVEMRERFSGLIQTTDENIDFVRVLSSRLRPPVLDVLGLGPAIEWQVDEHRARAGARFHLDLPEGQTPLPDLFGISLFRIAQEALTNILRHAEAGNIWVKLRVEGGLITLEVEDDGRGISPEAVEGLSSLGLMGMRERVLAIGGELTLGPREGGGTLVRVTVSHSGEQGEGETP